MEGSRGLKGGGIVVIKRREGGGRGRVESGEKEKCSSKLRVECESLTIIHELLYFS